MFPLGPDLCHFFRSINYPIGRGLLHNQSTVQGLGCNLFTMIYSLVAALLIREEIFSSSSFAMHLSSFGSTNDRVYPFPFTVSSHKSTEFKISRVSMLTCSKCSGMVDIYGKKDFFDNRFCCCIKYRISIR